MSAAQGDPELIRIAGAFRSNEAVYTGQGSPLYAALSKAGADDPYIHELCRHAMAAAAPVHLFTAVHFMLLGGLKDPLARFFPTLTKNPSPPTDAWPDFRRFCGEHRAALEELIRSHTVQMTYPYRARMLLPPLCHVADLAGEPLNLIEIGCSAGVLLTFDSYAYELRPGERVGPADAPFLLKGNVVGGPRLRIPRIAKRTGIDLNIIDARVEEDRRWMLATCFPELLTEQAQLAKAMDIVAATDIRWMEGDGLIHVVQALADTPDPVCVFHSACLFYWPQEARAALDAKLREASRGRTIYRLGLEPSERLNNVMSGLAAPDGRGAKVDKATGEAIVTVYRNGEAQSGIVARSAGNYADMWWET